ncbi:MAG: hypothetical protein B5M52_04795 [Helicobacteraceae bacterium 4484_230]|nr:MAG: hypothetical protein B5M52_04795 [Helicobacteraceae bacterium 4484_230]
MNLNIEKYLYAIDQSFAQKNERERMLTLGMIAAVLFGISYLLFWESSEKEYQAVKAQSEKSLKRLNVDKQYLAMHPETEIQKIADEITMIDNKAKVVRNDNEYIKFKIEQISELYYNEAVWGKYIDSIAENAKKYKIKLRSLSNQLSTDKSKFGHVLDIQISASGNYRNIYKFINSMEKSDLVIDIHDFNLSASETLDIDINSSVWGITH